MPRTRIDLNSVITAAIDLIDTAGLEALTLSNVAEALEVRPSALYTHVDGAGHLHYVVAVAATDNLTSTIRNAAIGVAGRDAVVAVAQAYREFARQNPGQYAATLSPPTADDARLDEACDNLLEVLVMVFQSLGLSEQQAANAAMSMRSMLHGFLALQSTITRTEHQGVRPPDVKPPSPGFDTVLDALLHGLLPQQRR